MRCDDPSVQTAVSSGISVSRERVYHSTSQSGTKGYENFVSDYDISPHPPPNNKH